MNKYKYILIMMCVFSTAVACGELLKDPYAGLVGNGGTSSGGGTIGGGTGGGTASEWLTLTSGANAVTKTNIGLDIFLFNTPASKPQSDNGLPTTDIINGTVTTVKSNASLIAEEPNLYLQNTPLEGVSPDMTDPHIELRLLENELLKSGKKQLNDNSDDTSKAIAKKTYTKGTTYQFFGLYGANPDTKFTATCVDISDEAYFFIQTDKKNILTSALLEKYKTGFKPIYTKIIEKFGPSGDVDRNGKIMIIFYNMTSQPSVIGYFYGGDKYENLTGDIKYSNEGDIFYMNTEFAADSQTTLATLSHEFQHITYFNNQYEKVNNGAQPSDFQNDTWINEGLSMLSSYYTGYAEKGSNNYDWIGQFLTQSYPSLSLTYWTDGNYGYSALFTHYLNDRFGEQMVKTLYEAPFSGILAVEYLMRLNGLSNDFNLLFNDFAQALYLSGTGLSTDVKFNFKSVDLTIYQRAGSTRKGLAYREAMVTGAKKEVTILPYSLALINSSGNASNVEIPVVTGLSAYAAILEKK